jgi:hypothetical protein
MVPPGGGGDRSARRRGMRNIIVRFWSKNHSIRPAGAVAARGVKIEDWRQTMNADRVEIFGKDT